MSIILNSCGMDVFQISPLQLLERCLILGTEAPTFYASSEERKMQSWACLDGLLKTPDGRKEVLDLIRDCDAKGRCPRKSNLIWALAQCVNFRSGDVDTQHTFINDAYGVVKQVVRTFADLYAFCDKCKVVNRPLKRFVCEVLLKDPKWVAYQATKYQKRVGWTARDLCRQAHPKCDDPVKMAIIRYIVKGVLSDGLEHDAIAYLKAVDTLKACKDPAEAAKAVREHRLVREHVPSCLLSSKDVWTALLQTDMPVTALLRNLNKLTITGVLADQEHVDVVCTRIGDCGLLKAAHIHPLNLLVALKMYSLGHGAKGSLSWEPVPRVTDALDKAFYAMFKHVEPIGNRVLLALDVSGSMHGNSCAGIECLDCREASGAMALVYAATEPQCTTMAFCHKFVPLPIDPNKPMVDNLDSMTGLPFGATDISLPFTWAEKEDKKFDTIIVMTDNETNANRIAPVDALRNYRRAMNVRTKLVVVAMAVNDFTVADPTDPGMLDVVGMDASVPAVIRDFAK